VIAADEVAARPAQDREPQRPRRRHDVAPEATLVGEARILLVDAAVDAAPEVLDELAEDAPVHRAEASPRVDPDARGHGARV
jgi:hypothetical protein